MAYNRAYRERMRLINPPRIPAHLSGKEIYARDREKILARKRAYEQRETTKQRKKEWRKQHQDRYRAKVKSARSRRRARERSACGDYSAREWLELKALYNNACLCCGRTELEENLSADHVIPLCKGGSNDIGNIQPLCKSCNSVKNTKTTDYRRVIYKPQRWGSKPANRDSR